MVIKWEKTSKQDLQDFKNYSKSSNVNEYLIELVRYVDDLAEKAYLGKIYLYTKLYLSNIY